MRKVIFDTKQFSREVITTNKEKLNLILGNTLAQCPTCLNSLSCVFKEEGKVEVELCNCFEK